MATFQFLSLFFGKPEAFWSSEVDITLNATECEGIKQNHLKLLTQRVSHSYFQGLKDMLLTTYNIIQCPTWLALVF